MEKLLTNRRLTHSQFNSVIGAVLMEGFLLAALIAKTCTAFFAKWNWLVLLIAYLVVSLIGTAIARKSDKPIMSLIGFNMVVAPAGAVLSVILPAFAASAIMHALIVTVLVALAMIIASQFEPKLFLKMGRALSISLLAVIVIELISVIAGFATWSWMNFIVAAIFALFIGYDMARAQYSEMTTDGAIDACVDLFIDGFNLFLRLLSIFGVDD
ncbi:MAG: Bax inhibitor-1 family protein [Candidatus Saccharibacteria bacterium]|nr:Bax inhibitor-1 family protein [Candidatus Saccharibacteria bacterium]